MLDFPSREEKNAIWDLYVSQYQLDANQRRPKDVQWSGAEIKACCRLSALLDVLLTQASQNVVPVSITAGESIVRLQAWASGRCLDATQGGIYEGGKTKRRRAVKTVGPAPSNNLAEQPGDTGLLHLLAFLIRELVFHRFAIHKLPSHPAHLGGGREISGATLFFEYWAAPVAAMPSPPASANAS